MRDHHSEECFDGNDNQDVEFIKKKIMNALGKGLHDLMHNKQVNQSKKSMTMMKKF